MSLSSVKSPPGSHVVLLLLSGLTPWQLRQTGRLGPWTLKDNFLCVKNWFFAILLPPLAFTFCALVVPLLPHVPVRFLRFFHQPPSHSNPLLNDCDNAMSSVTMYGLLTWDFTSPAHMSIVGSWPAQTYRQVYWVSHRYCNTNTPETCFPSCAHCQELMLPFTRLLSVKNWRRSSLPLCHQCSTPSPHPTHINSITNLVNLTS